MINVFITDSEKVEFLFKKRDCHLWQPLNLITEDVKSYISDAGCESVRHERLASYSLLFSALSTFYSCCPLGVDRDKDGKPYLILSEGEMPLFFSISHSGGLCAVAISEVVEIGIDLEGVPKASSAKRLEERFLCDFDAEDGEWGHDISIFSALPCPEGFIYEPIFNASGDGSARNTCVTSSEVMGRGEIFLGPICESFNNTIQEKEKDALYLFLKKWTVFEATLKCFGGGFLDASRVKELKERTGYAFFPLVFRGESFGLACSLRKE